MTLSETLEGFEVNQGDMPRGMDRLSRFFWHMNIPADYHDEDPSEFRRVCWLRTVHQPRFELEPGRKLYFREWIFKQLHVEARRREQRPVVCGDYNCCNPFHWDQVKGKRRGAKLEKDFEVVFPTVKNRSHLLFWLWRNMMLKQEETYRQRQDPRYWS